MNALLVAAASWSTHLPHAVAFVAAPLAAVIVAFVASDRGPQRPDEPRTFESAMDELEQLAVMWSAGGRQRTRAETSTGTRTVQLPVESKRGGERSRPVVFVAAGLSAAAGFIHAAVIPAHLRGNVWFGLFFIVTAVAQLGWAVRALPRPSASLWLGGMVLSAGICAVWIMSRTVGVPIGDGHVEPVGPLDAAATAYQLIFIALAGHELSRAAKA